MYTVISEYSGRTLLVTLLVLLANASTAAPVTLRFEALVSSVNTGSSPLDLPFNLQVGTTIVGSFTFDPINVDSTVKITQLTENHPIEFTIDSFSWASPSYSFESRDDVQGIEDNGGPIGPPSLPRDEIRLKRDLEGALGGDWTAEWAFQLAFGGDAAVLDGADLPASAADWASFEAASLVLSFRDTGSTANLVAQVVTVRIVPEPSSVMILCMGLAFIGLFLCPRCSHNPG